MRKGLILISPTWFLVGTLVYGIHLKTMNSVAGTSWVAFSLVGLGGYAFLLFFIGGLAKAAHSEKHFTQREKWFYGYLGGLLMVIVISCIYLMGHN
ncbi:LasU family protein [Lactiplantibacillus sp. WILCCON 0030]|uniref:LasU family protein n=1 Tax=Lactiplantibacillus brownii TaxID=3069269 RepID=A0ABU1AAG7_9LACO|nr:LasU family protein [Lactiplantibacillus brownii]MDQ7937944.1 LasU family protein [Lactiplantibacillus brownii]